MHTVTTPLSTSTYSDIALMESVAGFFGRLEFMTLGEAAFTRTSEFARQARRIVERAAERNRDNSCDMEDTDDRRRDHASLLVQPTTALQPMCTGCPGPTRQLDLDRTGSQVNDSEEEWRPPDSEDTSSNLRNDMTGGLDLSFLDVQDGYLLDEWLQQPVTHY